MPEEYRPFNQDTDPNYNREPGVVVIPGSNFAKENLKFEQFPGKYGSNPGNPYTYRPFPKMLYRAEHFGGKPLCMAAPPDAAEFTDPREFERAELRARKFTEQCQRIVKNETELQAAMENGWRESPREAVDYLLARDRSISDETAHRNYLDRNMSEAAKREIAAQELDAGGEHQPEITRKPVRRRRKIG